MKKIASYIICLLAVLFVLEQSDKLIKYYLSYSNDTYLDILSTPRYSDALRNKALGGDSKSQYDLGMIYLMGEGVEKDPCTAYKWFRKFSEHECSKGFYVLGCCYYNGLGTCIDHALAEKMWLRSACLKDAQAISALKNCFNIELKSGGKYHLVKQDSLIIAEIQTLHRNKICFKELITPNDIFINNQSKINAVGLNDTIYTILRNKRYDVVLIDQTDSIGKSYYTLNSDFDKISPTWSDINRFSSQIIIETKESQIKSIKIVSHNKSLLNQFVCLSTANGFVYDENNLGILIRKRPIKEYIKIQKDTIVCTRDVMAL